MAWVITRDGEEPEVLERARGFRDSNGTKHPRNVLLLWSDPELAAVGVYPLVDTNNRPNKRFNDNITYSLTDNGSTWERTWSATPNNARRKKQQIREIRDYATTLIEDEVGGEDEMWDEINEVLVNTAALLLGEPNNMGTNRINRMRARMKWVVDVRAQAKVYIQDTNGGEVFEPQDKTWPTAP